MNRIVFFLFLYLLPWANLFSQISLQWRAMVWDDAFSVFNSGKYFIGANTSYDSARAFVELNPYAPGQAGRLFLLQPRYMDFFDVSFNAYFGIRSTENTGGADGIVFAFSPVYIYPTTYGGQLDFDGSGGFGVEFDTYLNIEENDPNEEHIAVIRGSTDNHLHFETLTPATLEDGRWHLIKLSNRNGDIKVFLDGADRFTYTIPGYSPFSGYFGFTAATGTSFNDHAIDNVLVSTPMRTSTPLGAFSACDTVMFERLLTVLNNHPDQSPLTITGLDIKELDISGEFSFIGVQLPLQIPYLDSISFTLRFKGIAEGARRAVIRATASNGESIEDTLDIALQIPRTEWSQDSIGFPSTYVGSFNDRQIMLRNTGLVDVTIQSLISNSPAFFIVDPQNFPVTVKPNDSLIVRLRFQPSTAGSFSGTLRVENSCGIFTDVPFLGEGVLSILETEFQWPPLMLNPGKTGPLALYLLTDPSDKNVTGFDAALSYNSTIVSFVSAVLNQSQWSPGTVLQTLPAAPGKIILTVRSPKPLASNGMLLSLHFTAIISDTGCTEVEWDSLTWNPEGPSPGVPISIAKPGRVCINPSCRIPDGLTRRESNPGITNDPNPFNPSTTIRVKLHSEGFVELKVANAVGNIVQTLHRGVTKNGEHSFSFNCTFLPAGAYFAILTYEGKTFVHPMISIK